MLDEPSAVDVSLGCDGTGAAAGEEVWNREVALALLDNGAIAAAAVLEGVLLRGTANAGYTAAGEDGALVVENNEGVMACNASGAGVEEAAGGVVLRIIPTAASVEDVVHVVSVAWWSCS